jgi:hypothetical protein
MSNRTHNLEKLEEELNNLKRKDKALRASIAKEKKRLSAAGGSRLHAGFDSLGVNRHKIMRFKLTVSPQRTMEEAFVAVLLPPQLIITEQEKMSFYAAFTSALLQLPVVLVSQGIGDFWQAFGEPHFVCRLEEIGLAKLVWSEVGFGIPHN